MRTGSPVPVLFLSLIILSALPNSALPSVDGVVQSRPTTWSPFGPGTKNLVITVYGDFAVMFNAFVNGEVDLTDWPVQQADESSFGQNPDFFLTQGQEEFGIFELDINHHAPFLGIPMQENRGADSFNSPSTKQPTAAGVQIRKGLAHLLDKPSFINGIQLQGRAGYVDIQAAPAQSLSIGGAPPSELPQSILDEDKAEHPWFAGSVVSAYNLVADSLPDPFASFADRGWSGTADLRAACDHFVQAGISITPLGSNCADVAAGTAKLVSGGQKVTVFARTHPPRKAFGTIIFDAMNFLFDQRVTVPLCPPFYFSLCSTDEIFRTDPNKDDWNLYTGGWLLSSFPTHLYSLYHSSFASNACGGNRADFGSNYLFYCSPEFDQEVSAGQFATSFSDAALHFGNAAVIAHRNVMTIPVYSGAGQRFVALNGWDGLVSQLGRGFQTGFWSLLNMRQKPDYVPADARFKPGGGDPDLIRRGFSQLVNKLSPFHATTLWEFEVLDQIYDTMLKINPLTGGVGRQLVDWMTVRHSSSFDPNEVLAGITGVTTQVWTLRNDLRWHDGVPITADDVVYSIAAFSELCPTFIPCPPPPSSKALDSRTVEVKLTGQSVFYELNIGGLPILPRHIWAPLCGDPPSQTSTCADPAFDPMAAGIMIGSGPWVCKNLDTGTVGGSCTRPECPPGFACPAGGQIVGPLGRIFLTAYDGYHRGRPGVADSSLHKFSWSDVNNDAKIDILDIASAAISFGHPDLYWNSGQNPQAPSVGVNAEKVDIGELATVAFYFDQSLTGPFTPSQLIALDPDIDPFF